VIRRVRQPRRRAVRSTPGAFTPPRATAAGPSSRCFGRSARRGWRVTTPRRRPRFLYDGGTLLHVV